MKSQKAKGPVAPAPQGVLTMTVPEAGALIGLGRNAAYAAAERGDIPVIRLGEKILRVPRRAFFAKFNPGGGEAA